MDDLALNPPKQALIVQDVFINRSPIFLKDFAGTGIYYGTNLVQKMDSSSGSLVPQNNSS